MNTTRIGRQYPTAALTAPRIPKNDQAIIAKIVGEFTDRSRKDIQSWRQAIDAADHYETPKWSPLQDLYEYLRTDGHLGSQIDIRKGTVLSARYYIRDGKTSQEDKEKTKLLEKEWVLNLLGDLLDAQMKGYTFLQVTDVLAGKYYLIPRRNCVPQRDLVLLTVNDDKGILVTDKAFAGSMITVKSQYLFGILCDICPDLIWKKNARQAWAEFGEKFGLPLVTATTNKTNKADIDRIENMLISMAEAARAVLPEGTTMDIKDSAGKGDPYKVFLEQMRYCDEQISKRILGGTMISDDGSSRSQSEVHERTLNGILGEQDRKRLEFAVNDQLLPMFVAAGLLAEGDEFIFDRNKEIDIKTHWDIVSGMLSHYDVDQEWVSNTFNVPITALKPKPEPTNFFG